jgi:hypothetical protein
MTNERIAMRPMRSIRFCLAAVIACATLAAGKAGAQNSESDVTGMFLTGPDLCADGSLYADAFKGVYGGTLLEGIEPFMDFRVWGCSTGSDVVVSDVETLFAAYYWTPGMSYSYLCGQTRQTPHRNVSRGWDNYFITSCPPRSYVIVVTSIGVLPNGSLTDWRWGDLWSGWMWLP